MASILLLMRHGKAKAIEEGQNDIDRDLTDAGKRSLSASLEDELAHLDEDSGPVRVWASPSVRTIQTAVLVLDALKKRKVKVDGDISVVHSLWEQDPVAFLEEVRDCECDTVIAVGHNPMIESITEDLTGARIPFSTGALAAIKLNWDTAEGEIAPGTANETQNRLLWFAQGPISQHWRTLVQLEKTLRTKSDNVEKRLADFFEDPDDIETMHKFRVSIRTLRSLLAFVKPWQDAKQNDYLQSELKDIVAVTSRLRELDVLSEQARDATATSDEFVAFCETVAGEERARVADILASKRTRKSLERIAQQVKDIKWKRVCCAEGLPALVIRDRFDKLAGQLELDLADLDLADVEPTHDVRKTAKRVRYVAESFKDLIGEDAVGIAKGMEAHQDNLGAVCDARVNIDIINSLQNRPDITEPVTWDLALLRAQNETFLYTTLRNQNAQSALGADDIFAQ